MDFGKVGGSVTITEGEVGLLPFSLKTADADLQVKTVAELALGEIDSSVTVSLKAREGLPAMTLAYAGPPMALSRSEDISELSTKLGVTIMQAGIDELERLQEEQKRLAAEEEKQRIEDEARLAAYYAQRDELLLRRREAKVHAEMRAVEAERLRQLIEAERAANAEINKTEIRQRVREIRILRRLARQAQAAPAKKAGAAKAVAAPKPAAPAGTPGERGACGPGEPGGRAGHHLARHERLSDAVIFEIARMIGSKLRSLCSQPAPAATRARRSRGFFATRLIDLVDERGD